MNSESQEAPPANEDPSIPSLSDTNAPLQSSKSKRATWIIIGLSAGVLLCCGVVFFSILGTSLLKLYTEKAPIEAVLNKYMLSMENKDAESAYDLFSKRFQRQVPISSVEEMLEGNNYVLFEGFQNLSVVNINLSATVNTNPDLPQGMVATVNGLITYDGGFEGTFDGVLEKDDDIWQIYNIFVTVPPNKIK